MISDNLHELAERKLEISHVSRIDFSNVRFYDTCTILVRFFSLVTMTLCNAGRDKQSRHAIIGVNIYPADKEQIDTRTRGLLYSPSTVDDIQHTTPQRRVNTIYLQSKAGRESSRGAILARASLHKGNVNIIPRITRVTVSR